MVQASRLLLAVQARGPHHKTAVVSWEPYYAVFLEAAAFLDRVGFAVQNSPVAHVAVQHTLNNSGDAVLRRVGSKLDDLHRDRRRADYDMKNRYPEQAATAHDLVAIATDLIAWLDDVRDTAAPDRLGAIAVAVSAWLKGAQTAGLRQKSGTS